MYSPARRISRLRPPPDPARFRLVPFVAPRPAIRTAPPPAVARR